MTAPRVLVVFYSDTGNTRRAAERIATAMAADQESLVAPDLGGGLIGFIKRVWLALKGRPARLDPVRHDPDDYDLVVVAGPIWASRVSAPIRTYLQQFAPALPAAAFLTTMTADEPAAAFAEMGRILGHGPIATTAISEADRQNGHDEAKLRDFIRTLRRAPASAA